MAGREIINRLTIIIIIIINNSFSCRAQHTQVLHFKHFMQNNSLKPHKKEPCGVRTQFTDGETEALRDGVSGSGLPLPGRGRRITI